MDITMAANIILDDNADAGVFYPFCFHTTNVITANFYFSGSIAYTSRE